MVGQRVQMQLEVPTELIWPGASTKWGRLWGHLQI